MPQSLAAIESEVRALVGAARRARTRRAEPLAAAAADAGRRSRVQRGSSGARSRRRSTRRASGAWSTGALTPGDLLRLPQALTIRERPTGRRGGRGGARRATRAAPSSDALADLDTMRSREGRSPARRPRSAARRPSPTSSSGSPRPPTKGARRWKQRLTERVRELRVELQADETAVAQEIVRMASRSDISEEVARFRGHVSHWVRARRQRRAVRPQARFPAAGDEPRSEHDGLEGRRAARVRAHHRGEGGAREDARAGPECRVRAGSQAGTGSVGGRGLLFIVSAPSGAGKTTLVERLVEQTPRLKMSRSYTSRARAGRRSRRRGL